MPLKWYPWFIIESSEPEYRVGRTYKWYLASSLRANVMGFAASMALVNDVTPRYKSGAWYGKLIRVIHVYYSSEESRKALYILGLTCRFYALVLHKSAFHARDSSPAQKSKISYAIGFKRFKRETAGATPRCILSAQVLEEWIAVTQRVKNADMKRIEE